MPCAACIADAFQQCNAAWWQACRFRNPNIHMGCVTFWFRLRVFRCCAAAISTVVLPPGTHAPPQLGHDAVHVAYTVVMNVFVSVV
jgi:hypothetical protein